MSGGFVKVTNKRVKFQRDMSNDGSAKVPKRGSSNASSKKEEDDNLLELDAQFPK